MARRKTWTAVVRAPEFFTNLQGRFEAQCNGSYHDLVRLCHGDDPVWVHNRITREYRKKWTGKSRLRNGLKIRFIPDAAP